MGILDAPGYSRSDANAAFPRKTPRIILPLGDSISYLDCGYLSEAPSSLRTPATAYQVDGAKAAGMYAWANFYLGHPFKFVGNAAVPGNTSEDMLARIDAALAIPSDVVSVLAGANDFAAGWAASRTITALAAIYAKVLASGKRLMVLTTMPRSTMNTTAGYLYLGTLNRWIVSYARSTPGVLFADIASSITDPATGVPYNVGVPYHTADGTHPNAYGAMIMGKRIATALAPIAVPANVFSTNGNVDPTNLMRNAANIGTTGTVANGITGTVGANWALGALSGSAVAAASKVARTDGEQGEWTRIVIGPTNTATIYAAGAVLWDATGAAGVRVGDTIVCAVEVRTASLVGVSLFNGGSYHPNSQALDLGGSWVNGTGAIPDGTYTFLVEGIVIGASATYLQTRVHVNATSGTLDIGRATVFRAI